MDWTTHSKGLLTTRKCYCHTINCRQTSNSKMITTHGALLQALLAWYGARVEVHSYYTTCACLLTSWQHLCVCLSYKQVASVTLNAMYCILEAFASNWRWPAGLSWLLLKFSVGMWEVSSSHSRRMSHSFTLSHHTKTKHLDTLFKSWNSYSINPLVDQPKFNLQQNWCSLYQGKNTNYYMVLASQMWACAGCFKLLTEHHFFWFWTVSQIKQTIFIPPLGVWEKVCCIFYFINLLCYTLHFLCCKCVYAISYAI